jgi:hypothetical protein
LFSFLFNFRNLNNAYRRALRKIPREPGMLVVSITRLDRNTRVAPGVGALHDERAARVLGIREGPIGVLGLTLDLVPEIQVPETWNGRFGPTYCFKKLWP